MITLLLHLLRLLPFLFGGHRQRPANTGVNTVAAPGTHQTPRAEFRGTLPRKSVGLKNYWVNNWGRPENMGVDTDGANRSRISRPDAGPEISETIPEEFRGTATKCARRARPYLRSILVRLHVITPVIDCRGSRVASGVLPISASYTVRGRRGRRTTVF